MVAGLSIYAWKDWFKSLCGLILLMAVIEHPDMPKSILGIQGFNLWNVLFGVILLAWLMNRRRRGLVWDMPRHMSILLLSCLGVILVGTLRTAVNPGHLQDYPLSSLVSEELINTVKWVIPGILLFDGCRTRKQTVMALVCLLTTYFVLAVQVIRWMPLAAISDSDVMMQARHHLESDVGYWGSDLAVVFAGGCWGLLAALSLIAKRRYRVVVMVGAAVVAVGLALTGGRMGYGTWGVVGGTLCAAKWRRYLLLAPVLLFLLPIVFPGATARMMHGFGTTDVTGQETTDEEAVTAGRTLFWPYVIDEIAKSRWIGHGRLAMKTTGLYYRIETEHPGTSAPHPHNMYLETLLDNGILGSIPIFVLWGTALWYSAKLFRSTNRLYSAVGGLSFALALSSLIGGIGGQHFYPQEHTLGIWAAIFLTMRVCVAEKRAQQAVEAQPVLDVQLATPDREVAFAAADEAVWK